jgi:type IV pilus assembly protein PilV
MKNTIKFQDGFSLVEVLISVLVLTLGLLGIAALQANVVKYNHSAQLRSMAVYQAANMIDRMRANLAGVTAGNYNNVSGIPTAPTCTSCSSSETATKDINAWNNENSLLLPAGQGTVTGNGSIFTITVRWDNDRTGVTGTNCSGNSQVDLSCVTMGVEL